MGLVLAAAETEAEVGLNHVVPEVWLFEGPVAGDLDRSDAATVLLYPNDVGVLRMAVGHLTSTAWRSLVLNLDAGGNDVSLIDLPALPGTWDVAGVAAAAVSSDGSHGHALGVGDVDGDGMDDLSIGGMHPSVPGFPSARGGVSIFRGPIAGTLDPAADAWARYQAFDVDMVGVYGSGHYAPSIVGDLDCDGRDDVVLPGEDLAPVAPMDAPGTPRQGGAVAFGGATPGDHAFADAESLLYGTCSGSAGVHQEGVGDVTGDGHLDVAIGAPDVWIDGRLRGATFVVSNLPSVRGYASLAAASAAILVGEGGMFGPAYPAGDLNQDGVGDLVVTDGWGPGNGRVYLFLGPLSGTISALDADLVLHGGRRDQAFGHEARGVGDVTGDGAPDLLVGARNAWWNGRNGGAVYLFSGADLLGAM